MSKPIIPTLFVPEVSYLVYVKKEYVIEFEKKPRPELVKFVRKVKNR